MRRFFRCAAQVIEKDHPALAEKLRQATPNWMRHTHATHALAKGVELSAVRDNLRHASISTTSIYLHADDVKRARKFGQAFTGRPPYSKIKGDFGSFITSALMIANRPNRGQRPSRTPMPRDHEWG